MIKNNILKELAYLHDNHSVSMRSEKSVNDQIPDNISVASSHSQASSHLSFDRVSELDNKNLRKGANWHPFISPTDLENLCPELLEDLRQNSIDLYIRNNRKRAKRCPKPDCKGWGLLYQNEWKCGTCNSHLCWFCEK